MKIAVLVHSLAGIGGIAKQTICMSKELAAMGHVVTVWSSTYNRASCYPECTAGLDIRALSYSDSAISETTSKLSRKGLVGHLGFLWDCYRIQIALAQTMPGGYDVVNAYGHTISWAAAEYKRRFETPIVWMCDDFWAPASHRYQVTPNSASKIKRSIKELICSPFERYDRTAVSEIDEVVVLSERAKRQMSNHYGVNASIIRAGVESTRFADGNGSLIRSHYASKGSFLLLTVCTLMPRRRIEDVVGAVRILIAEGYDITYLVAGPYKDPEYTNFLQEEISRCDLGDRVKFVGQVLDEELVHFYHASDVFIWAADENQSWGLAAMEAMAAGKPTIVSRGNGLAEVLEDGGNTFLVPTRSPQAIADAVKRLIEDPVLAQSVAQRGQRLVKERYTWPRIAEAMLELLEGAVEKQDYQSSKTVRASSRFHC